MLIYKLRAVECIVSFFIMIVCHSLVWCQDNQIDQLTYRMTDSLSYLQLSDKQHNQAFQINKSAATSLLHLEHISMQDSSINEREFIQQVIMIHKERNQSLLKILTGEQQELFVDHRAERLAELQTHIMISSLHLTEEQIPEVYRINLSKADEILRNADELKNSRSRTERMNVARSLRTNMKEKDSELKVILSNDQYSEYQRSREIIYAAVKERAKNMRY